MNRLLRILSAPLRWLVADPYRVAALVLLLLGAALRFLFLPDARFTGDEALFFQEATRAAWGEKFPTLGPAVTGGPLHHPGGTFYLLMAGPLTLSRSPLAAMGLVVLLNTIAYGLLATMVRRVMGRRVALAFLLIMVFSPWTFFYSDRIWNSNLVLVVSAVFLWALVHVAMIPRSRRLFWVVFSLVIFPQFHLSVPLLAFVGLVVLLVFRPRLNWKAGLWGLAAGAALYVPYLVREFGNGFQNTRLFLTGLGTGGEGAPEALRGLIGFLTLPTAEMSYFAERGYWFDHHQLAYYTDGAGLEKMAAFFGGGQAGWFLVVLMAISVGLAALALLYATGYTILRGLRRNARDWNPLAVAFFAALAAAPLVFLLTGKPYFPHYIYSLYPIAFVPLLILLRRLLRIRGANAVVAALLGALATGQVAMSSVYYERVDGVVGVESSEQIVRTIYETGRDRSCHISFDVEKSRLNAYPLQLLARWSLLRPIHHDRHAKLRYRVFSPSRWARFQALPAHRQRIDGRKLSGHRELTHAVLAWAE